LIAPRHTFLECDSSPIHLSTRPRYIRNIEYTILDRTSTHTQIKTASVPPFVCAGEVSDDRSGISIVCKVAFAECFKRKTAVRRLQVRSRKKPTVPCRVCGVGHKKWNVDPGERDMIVISCMAKRPSSLQDIESSFDSSEAVTLQYKRSYGKIP
jgi:hypothetical protein